MGNRLNIFRAICRVVALCAATAVIYLLLVAGKFFVFPFFALNRRWRNFIFRLWARCVAFIAGMKINVRGQVPQSPFFLVANHLSYMDIVALAAQIDCVFVAKSDVANWTVIGFLCRSIKTIFINRNLRRDIPRVLGSISQAMKEGYGVVLFAEGTSTRGKTVAPFKPSLLELAAQTELPVHYASITYRVPQDSPSADTSICWWGDMTFPKHLFGLFQIREFKVEIIFGAQPIQATDRKTLSENLWSAVHKQFRPVVVTK